jgi:MYXO-CTERM domain-containing protein
MNQRKLELLRFALVAVLLSCSSHDGGDSKRGASSSSSTSVASLRSFAAGDHGFAALGSTYHAEVNTAGAIRLFARRGAPGMGGAEDASLQLETISLARAGVTPHLLPQRAPSARLGPDGVVAVDRGPALERLEAREDGVEESWRFDGIPQGSGDVIVRVRAAGGRFAGSTPRGLRFVDGAGDAFIYGKASWVDAAGKRSPLSARYLAGAVEITVPTALLDASAYPAILDPFIGVETPIEGPVYVPSSNANTPSVAGNGTDYLVTWVNGNTIYAAIAKGSGAVGLPTPITVVTGNDGKTQPRAAWDGSEWIVVWGDTSNGGVYMRRIAAAGTLLNQPQNNDQGFLVSSAFAQSVDVAYDGSELLIVYAQNDIYAHPHVYAVRMSPSGARIDTTTLTITSGSYQQTTPRVVFDGTEFFIAWADSRSSPSSSTAWDIYGARVTHAGQLLDGPTDTGGTPISTATGDQVNPALASDGTVAFVVWTDSRGTSPAYYAARVDPSVGLVDGPASTGGILLGSAAYVGDAPSVGFDGVEYVAAWSTRDSSLTGGNIAGVRVSSAGALLGTAGSQVLTISGGPQSNSVPAVAGGASGAFVAWLDTRLTKTEIFGTRIDTSGALLDGTVAERGFLVSQEPVSRSWGVVASNGSSFLVAWMDNRDQSSLGADVYAIRLDAGGTPIDSAAFPIATGIRIANFQLAIASSGSGYAIAYGVGSGSALTVQVRFVNADGTLVNGPASSPGLILGQNSEAPAAIAWNGTDYLFVWQEYFSSSGTTQLFGARTSATGQVRPSTAPDGSFPVVTTTHNDTNPALGSDGTNFLLLWNGGSQINGSRIGPNGNRLDGTVTTEGFTVYANSQGYPETASVAFNGLNYVALLNDLSTGLYTRAISTQGQVTTTSVNFSGGDGTIAFDGSVFWALWDTSAGGVRGARLRDDGTARDTTPMSISVSTADFRPSVAGLIPGEVLAVYQVGSDLRSVVILDDTANGVACTDASQCSSGVCEDGVCCDRPCGGTTPDCQSCSVAAGAAKDGVCGVSASGTTCRPVAGACDIAETCDGTTTTCPADRFVKIGTTCLDATDCASAATCSGTGAACGTPTSVSDGTACDGDAGSCKSGACVLPRDAGPDALADAGIDASTVPKDAAVADAQGEEDASSESGASMEDGSLPEAAASADAAPAPDSSTGSPQSTVDAEATEDAAATTSSGPDASPAGQTEGSPGCGCHVAGRSDRPMAWLLAVLGLVAVLARRRRVVLSDRCDTQSGECE